MVKPKQDNTLAGLVMRSLSSVQVCGLPP